MKTIAALCALGLLLTACAAPLARLPAAEPVPTAWVETVVSRDEPTVPAAEGTFPSAPSPSATGAPDQPPTRYTITAIFNWDNRRLDVRERIQYTNQTGEALRVLVLAVEANRWPGAFELTGLRWEAATPIDSYQLSGIRLTIPLEHALQSGQTLELNLDYTLTLPLRAGPLGFTGRQANFGDWYPFLPVYKPGKGWQVHDPAAVGEHLVYETADYQVEIQTASADQPLVLAASATAEAGTPAGQYRYQLKGARCFSWTVSPEYVISEVKADAVTVRSYVFPEHAQAGAAAAQTTAEALALYSQLFAPYPHTSLALVESDFPDGMEYDGLYFIGEEYFASYDQTPMNYLTIIAAHETAHQWWFGLVGNDPAMEPWLDEALATYCEYLFYTWRYPDLADWWWRLRIDYYDPAGAVDQTIYDLPSFRPYVNAVYLRGARMIHSLRLEMGDEAFFAALAEYSRVYTRKTVSGEQFWAVLSAHTPNSLRAAVEGYLRTVPSVLR